MKIEGGVDTTGNWDELNRTDSHTVQTLSASRLYRDLRGTVMNMYPRYKQLYTLHYKHYLQMILVSRVQFRAEQIGRFTTCAFSSETTQTHSTFQSANKRAAKNK